MSWTIACFCGRVYVSPPVGACPQCGSALPRVHRPAPAPAPVLGRRT